MQYMAIKAGVPITIFTVIPSYSLRSLVIVVAMFLKLMAEPAMRRNRMPLRESRGRRQTSISHCRYASDEFSSPCQHISVYWLTVSWRQSCLFSTSRISRIIASGSKILVVFILHVKRRLRGSSTDGACDALCPLTAPWTVGLDDIDSSTTLAAADVFAPVFCSLVILLSLCNTYTTVNVLLYLLT